MNFDYSTETITPTTSLTIGGNAALIVPVGTTAQRPTDTVGMIRYNTDTPGLEFNTGGGFSAIGGLGADPTISGNIGMVIPSGTTAQETGTTIGTIRFNTDLGNIRVRNSTSWLSLVADSTAFSTTGLTFSGSTSPLTLSTSAGTAGQVLTSAGPGATPTWTTAGSGTSDPSGSATINFGSAPGTNFISTVINNASITPASEILVWMMAEATATHNAIEHMMVGLRLTAGNIVNGVSFTIYALTDLRLTGTFTVRWKFKI